MPRRKGVVGKKQVNLAKLLGVKGSTGPKPMFGRDMTSGETIAYERMVELAKDDPEKAMEKYNAFGPELEARRFIDILVKHKGGLVPAMREAYPQLGHDQTEIAFRKGLRLLEGTRVKELLKEEMDAMGISVASVITRVNDIANKEDAKDQDKLRALELLGKFKEVGALTQSTGDKITYNLNISEDAARRLLERRQQYSIGEGGHYIGQRDSDCHVIDGEEVIDGLHNTDAEGVRTELAS